MTPNHDQLSNAVTRHLLRIDAKIEATKADVEKLNVRKKAIPPLTENRAMQERIILAGFPVHDVDDYRYREFSTENGWDSDERCRRLTVSFTIVHEKSKRGMRVTLPKNNPGTLMAAKYERETGNEDRKIDAAKSANCNKVAALERLRNPPALNSFRSYLRAQWAPKTATVLLSDRQLADLSESFLATRNASACEIG